MTKSEIYVVEIQKNSDFIQHWASYETLKRVEMEGVLYENKIFSNSYSIGQAVETGAWDDSITVPRGWQAEIINTTQLCSLIKTTR